jgi:hypothetical protein
VKYSLAWQSLSLASLFALAACGGSDGGSTPVPPPPPAPAVLAVSGTAATGAAIAGGLVEVKCATGSGSVSTAPDGTYQVDVTSGVLPCVLRATGGGGVLHSLVATGGASVVANITPLTELLAANVTGADPDALFTTFDATAQARVTPAAVARAVSTLLAGLQGTIDLTGVDPIGGTLVAAHGAISGNALDALLDQLAAAMAASHTTLADLGTAIATSTPETTPVLHQIAAAASTCSALRSGGYVVINPHETANDTAYAAYHLAIDAVTLQVTDIEPGHEPDSATLTAVDGHPCSFTYDGEFGTETMLASPGGVIVVQSPSFTGPTRTSLLVPAQSIVLSQLAGTWNYMAYVRDTASGPLVPANGVRVIDGAGKFVSGTDCAGLACADSSASNQPGDLVASAAGGFTIADEGGGVSRAFAFVADNGAMSLYVLDPAEGGLSVFTRQSALSLPTVGAVTKFWDLTVGSGSFRWAPVNNAQGGAGVTANNTVTVTTVDAAAGSYTRIRESDQRVDGFTINSPRDGIRARPAGMNYNAALMMPIEGTGIVVYTSVTAGQNFFGISVNQP